MKKQLDQTRRNALRWLGAGSATGPSGLFGANAAAQDLPQPPPTQQVWPPYALKS